jgi:hypothetical protein
LELYTENLPFLPLENFRLARKHCGPRRRIRLLATVQVVNDACVILLVRAGEADRRGRLARLAAGDVDLCAFLHPRVSKPFATRRGRSKVLT